MKFLFKFFFKTAIHIAVEKENIEMIQLLLDNSKVDVNLKSIFKFNIFI